jgi:class I fructose-bisphosphate aldolase
VGIGYTIYPGSSARIEMYSKLRELGEEAKANGLVLVVWSYPRGSGLSKEGETGIDVTGLCRRTSPRSSARTSSRSSCRPHTSSRLPAKKVYETEKVPVGTLAERVRHVVQSTFAGRRVVDLLGRAGRG